MQKTPHSFRENQQIEMKQIAGGQKYCRVACLISREKYMSDKLSEFSKFVVSNA
jgi:hypothetical protein